MATSGGPDIVRNGLVFGMDTGYGVADNNTSTKFYLGKPTTNAFTYSNFTPAGYGGDGVLQTGALDPFGTTDNPVYRKTGKLRFGPTDGTDVGTLYYGNTYTFSIYLRHVPGETQTTSAEFDINDRTNSINYVGDLGSNMTFEWKRFSVTALHNNSSNYHFIDIGVYQGSNVYEWCCPQIDEGSIATPFISNGTIRSSTQSLIDLTKTTDIDVSNVSFDSTGQPTFDGTDDRITIPAGAYPTIGTNDFTFEVISKNTKTYSYNHFFSVRDQYHIALKMENSGNRGIYVYRSSGLSTYTDIPVTAPSTSEFYHIVCKREGDNLEIYLNGVSKGTKSGWNSISIDNNIHASYIGWGNGSEYNGGDIPVVKIYNRALSDQEVQQNYNSYKNRFNL